MDDVCRQYHDTPHLWSRVTVQPSVGRAVIPIVLHLLCGVALVVGAMFCVRAVVVETFYVSSGSMTPTLRVNHHLIVNKIAYGLRTPLSVEPLVQWSAPERGEIVVFSPPDDDHTLIDESTRSMVKRVIGIAGDSIFISDEGVSVNGRLISEPYARLGRGSAVRQQSFVVPEGAVFLLGDNRDESFDSRFWRVPFIRTERLLGSVAAVY